MNTIDSQSHNIQHSPSKRERGEGLGLSLLLFLFLFSVSSTLLAQPGTWDREKYPDLPNPKPALNMKAAKKMMKRLDASKASGKVRPDHLNNALQPAFPPIINQSGGSCGAASSIYYQFTNQINTARFTSADSDERRYATHFPWLIANNSPSGTGYDRLGKDVGIASCATYDGTTYSRTYGYSGQDADDPDCGWMQGYDRWFAAMHNRILSGNSFPMHCGTPEGREIVKNYLWNRCGDESYASGGICGIGVAAGPFASNIPNTEANRAAGVVGMEYITDWNETYNHAMTIVGYDDRIEFDLDGNGTIGEQPNADGDDEVGAWIIANSWGNWSNAGFIYCPYERSNCVKGWPKENSFTPGYYEVMRDYRPLRTLRVKMEYSRRSEMALHVGIAQDLDATKPEKSIALTHFEYCGDGNKGKTQPAPEVPMLGRWADGELHYEPMEFGYDLTELTSDCDLSRPIKYFFWVETRSWGVGEGKIYEVSIIDYNLDRKGVEVPFEIMEPINVPSAGKKTQLTAVVSTDYVPEPRNLIVSGLTLTWQAPAGSLYEPTGYKVYHDGELYATITNGQLRTTIEPMGAYTVSALYEVSGYEAESKQSMPVSAASGEAVGTNTLANLNPGSKIIIPDLCDRSLEDFTLEFWLFQTKSATKDSYGFRIKADTTQYFFKIISGNQIEFGNDGGSYTRYTTALSRARIQHVAIVNQGINGKLYINGKQVHSWNNAYSHYGIKGPARLVIGETEGTTTNYKKVYDAPWTGYFDELRFWKRALTAAEIRSQYQKDVAQPLIYEDLLHYYNMCTREGEDGELYLVDECGNSDGEIVGAENITFEDFPLDNNHNPIATETTANFSVASTAVVGKPVVILNKSAINTAQWQWTFTGADVESITGNANPSIVFTQVGEQTVTLKTTTPYGTTAEKSTTVTVAAATLPDVDFSIPEGDIPAGTHVAFINNSTPIEAANYEWNIEGAESPIVKATNAGATFVEEGTYTVTLTAYSPEGSRSTSKTVSVGAVAPEAAFSLRNNVIIKGESVDLIDESRFKPNAWTWDLESSFDVFRLKEQSQSVTIDVPGIYNVTLTASNSKGASSLTRKKAITVCNADGKNGLRLDGADDLVTAGSPLTDASVKQWTIEWWMLPGRVTDNAFHIGDNASTMQLYVKPTGEIVVESKNRTFASDEGAVVFDEWHHYAVTFKSGTVSFYRDAQLITTGRFTGVSSHPALEAFTIGGSELPFNGFIDELRVWNYAMKQTEITPVANEPVADPTADERLLLYYDFNQTSGNVIDRSGHTLTGTRTNFGPDGDAWDSSLGIFCLHPSGNAVNDVTANYLKNYVHPFKTASGTVNPDNSSRYLKLLMNNTTSPWKQLNNIKKGNILTEWHVDKDKNYYMTLEVEYSGFETTVSDLMVFQTVELPAGFWTFTAGRDGDTYSYNWMPDNCWIAAALGDQLPLSENLASEALAYDKLDNNSVNFMLNETSTVSLGVIANLANKQCVAIGKFELLYKPLTEISGHDIDGISEPSVKAEPTLMATGGLGCINIRVEKPQHVTVVDLTGKSLFSDWLDFDARIPAKRGIYVVNSQKVVVR